MAVYLLLNCLVAYPLYSEYRNRNPLNGPLNQSFEQIYTFGHRGIFAKFLNQTDTKAITSFNDLTYNMSQTRNITAMSTIYQKNASFTDYIQFQYLGVYDPVSKRGMMSGKVIQPENITFSDVWKNYTERINSSGPFPTEEEIFVNDNGSYGTTTGCNLTCYFTISEVQRPIRQNKYLPDIRHNLEEASYFNATHETVANLTQHVVSEECGFNITVVGPIENQAFWISSTLWYSFAFIVLGALALLSGLRQVFLLNSPQRLQKVSATSFLLQFLYDMFLSVYYLNFVDNIPLSKNPLILCSTILLLLAFMVDIVILFKCLQYNNVSIRVLNVVMLILLVSVIIYFVLYDLVDNRVNFVLLMVVSSYWLTQSIESAVRDSPPKMLTFDYILVQSFVKYAPAIYFFGFKDNFLYVQVESWFLPTMAVWFSIQVVFILLQFFFGGRLISPLLRKCKKGSSGTNGYDYEKQHIWMFNIENLDEYVSNENVLRMAKELNLSAFEYLQSVNRTRYVPFVPGGSQNSGADGVQGSSGHKTHASSSSDNLLDTMPTNSVSNYSIAQVCQNPLHEHSLLYNPHLDVRDLPSVVGQFAQMAEVLKRVESGDQLCCFYLLDPTALDGAFSCPICMDELKIGSNGPCQRCITRSFDQKELQQLGYPSSGGTRQDAVFVTPCGHMFHRGCIGKWAAEQQQCPVDRQPLPAVPIGVWWE